jgi:acetoacetyl-CoA synthetase
VLDVADFASFCKSRKDTTRRRKTKGKTLMVDEGQLLWMPSKAFAESSNVAAFMRWLRTERGLAFKDYGALWRWSVDQLEDFWQAIWDYFDIHSASPATSVLGSRSMPGARWFEGARVNYAEHVLRHENSGDFNRPVLHHCSELRELQSMSWSDLGRQVRILATELRKLGVKPADRVVAYMPNIPETVIAMLATTAIGAVWSTAAPEFGVETVVDRFSQTAPKLMFVVDGYRYGGKDFDRRGHIAEIVGAVASIETVVFLNYLDANASWLPAPPRVVSWHSLLDHPPVDAASFRFEYVSSDHPLWILFSSGTTGLPKAIVHSHVGVLLEHYKSSAFHLNVRPGSCMLFYSTTGWMMWNTLMWAPLMNASAVLYDGHPAHPDPDSLLDLAARTGANSFGTSPTFIQNMQKLGLVPETVHDLSKLENIFLVGSPATPETFEWLYANVKSDIWITSQSGGTEFCSGLVGGVPTLPVYAGEIQARALAADVHAFDEHGADVLDEVGELVITAPMPSMPIFLWGDSDFARYRESYFDQYPGVWRHGDSIKINQRGGCYVYGRSDATLNRYGVRIGSAEIYRTLDTIEDIADGMVVCIEEKDGGFYMPLFVTLRDGLTLDDALKGEISAKLRRERSPRHVPDEIIAVPAIPYTLTGKKMEIPVRKLLMGTAVERAVAKGAMKDPEVITWYADFAARRLHNQTE